ncbi:MAG: hypothetical protein IPL89_16185 [Acidobacteria bacterium]|nr:hypothetical protein [Acidobacteriota bacterium]
MGPRRLPKQPVFLVGHLSAGASLARSRPSRAERVAAVALVSPLGAAPYGFTDTLKWKAMSRRAVLESVPSPPSEVPPRTASEGDAWQEGAPVARAVEGRRPAPSKKADALLGVTEKSGGRRPRGALFA